MPEPPSAPPGGLSSGEPLVFVSDTTPEGDQLAAALRARGYSVVDVALDDLRRRASVSLPTLVLCDLDAAGALDSLSSLLDLPDAEHIELLLLGESDAALQGAATALGHEPGGLFARPLDVYAVLRKVELLLGAPSGLPGGSLMPPSRGSRGPVSRPGMPPPSSDSRRPPPSAMPVTAANPTRGDAADRGDNNPAEVELPPVIESSHPPPGVPSVFPSPSSPPLSDRPLLPLDSGAPSGAPSSYDESVEPSVQPWGAAASEEGEQGLPSQIPKAELSSELTDLLREAEQRVRQQVVTSSMPPSEDAPFDGDLDAAIPAELLEALDAPLRPGDAGDGHGSGSGAVPGTHGGSDASHTGSSTGTDEGGTGSAAGTGRTPAQAADDARSAQRSGTGSEVGRTSVKRHPSLAPVTAAGETTGTGTGHAGTRTDAPAPGQEAPTPVPPARARSVPPTSARQRAPTSAPPSRSRRERPLSASPARSADAAPTSAPPARGRAAPTPAPTSAGRGGPPPLAQPVESRPTFTSSPGTAVDRGAPTLAPEEMNDARLSPSRLAPPPIPRGTGWDPAAPAASQPATTPPAAQRAPAPPVPASAPPIQIPSTLGPKDANRAMAQLIRARYSGSLALENDAGIRRVVFRDGDFITAASSAEGESLVAFLVRRGVLGEDVAAALGRKVAPFGRHAGAALVAHGHLRQDELWPVLRAHAEWIVGRALAMSSGVASLEQDVPARMSGEPAVFGGATGAEVFVEMVRRTLHPSVAIEWLGGGDARLTEGPATALLGECGLPEHEVALIHRARDATVKELVAAGRSPEVAAVLYAVTALAVLRRPLPSAAPADHVPVQQKPAPVDDLDDAARRARIETRHALVEEGDYFAVLGIEHRATGHEVRRAYLDLRREFDPNRILTAATVDLREEVEEIVEVVEEAYEILRDQVRRDRYRRALEATP